MKVIIRYELVFRMVDPELWYTQDDGTEIPRNLTQITNNQ